MKLIILGSGTSIPHPRRAASSFWLETSAGNLLLDMSADALHRMAQEGLDWANLDAIWISHFHLDHMGGVAPFLFGCRAAPETQHRAKPLMIAGAPGLKSILTAIDESNNYRLFKQPFPVTFVEIEAGNSFELLPGLQAATFSTPHTNESLAIRLTDKAGSIIVYTSDTGFTEELSGFAEGASILLMESAFFKNKPVEKHLELAEAVRIAAASRAQKLILTHLYAEWDGIDLAAEAGKLWSGETIEAKDGLRIEF